MSWMFQGFICTECAQLSAAEICVPNLDCQQLWRTFARSEASRAEDSARSRSAVSDAIACWPAVPSPCNRSRAASRSMTFLFCTDSEAARLTSEFHVNPHSDIFEVKWTVRKAVKLVGACLCRRPNPTSKTGLDRIHRSACYQEPNVSRQMQSSKQSEYNCPTSVVTTDTWEAVGLSSRMINRARCRDRSSACL